MALGMNLDFWSRTHRTFTGTLLTEEGQIVKLSENHILVHDGNSEFPLLLEKSVDRLDFSRLHEISAIVVLLRQRWT